MDSAQEAVGKVRAEGKNTGPMEILELDLTSLKSVKDFATLFQIKYKSVVTLKKIFEITFHETFICRSLDMLILNAAVMGLPFALTEDGYETHFQVNHLSHFYLALLMKPFLVKTLCSRVAFVSSESHRLTRVLTKSDQILILLCADFRFWT